MRVALVNYGHFPEHTEPEQVLDGFRTLIGWAEGLQTAGAEVSVIQGFSRDARLRRGGIDYRMVAGRFAPFRRWRVPRRLHKAVLRARPDIVHLNGMLYGIQALALRWLLPASCALVLQHHGARPDRGLAAIPQRWGLGLADGFFFTGRGNAAPWRQARLIRGSQRLFEITEGSSRFEMMEREAARADTGLEGRPVFFWAGNLDANKDPLTVLEGFASALADLPEARLYMAYRFDRLLPDVRDRIASSPALQRAVQLLGTIPYERMEGYFNSADFLLQGSHREACGYALVDALACGVVPVVTDIAPFRFITRESVGALWPPGDVEALRAAIGRLARRALEPQRRAARALFEQNHSYRAICGQALEAYREMLEARREAIR